MIDIAKRIAIVAVAFLVAAFVAAKARADEPPQCNLPGWTIVKADICRCGIACACADESRGSYIAGTKTVKAFPPTVRQSLTVRPEVMFIQPRSGTHSHTCQNPTCPFTQTGFKYSWNDKNHSHTCPYCLTEQTVADRKTRVATVLVDQNAIPKAASHAAVQPAPAPARSVQTTSFYVLPRASAGGCADGQCAVVR